VIHKENGGSSSARNLGIEESSGEYLGFVDSDDYAEADMYERLLQAALSYDAAIVQVGRNEVDQEGNALPDICIPPEETDVIGSQDFLKELLMHRGDCSFCTKLIRRDCFELGKFPLGVLNEDFHLLIKMLTVIDKVVSLPGYGYHVFYRIGSNTRKEKKDHFSRVFGDSVDNADVALSLVKEQYPALLQVAYRFGVFQRIEYLLHIPIGQMVKDNRQYKEIISWLRRHWFMAMKNPILTVKNKVYHTLFAIAPKGIRVVHKYLRGI
jgi:glycosyltransferase involved in cell wall biosynthesis